MHGQGRWVGDSGVVTEGQFKDDRVHGYYRRYWSGGDYLIGVAKAGSNVW